MNENWWISLIGLGLTILLFVLILVSVPIDKIYVKKIKTYQVVDNNKTYICPIGYTYNNKKCTKTLKALEK